MQAKHKIPRDTLLKNYSVQPIEYIDSFFPSAELRTLIQDYSELFCLESHEPENFKKNLISETDHALMPVVIHHNQYATSPKFKTKFYDEKKTLYSPFEATCLTINRLDEKLWFYLDEEGHTKGPFSTVDMDRWFNHGELHGSSKVAYDQREKFCKIYKFVEIFKEFDKKTEEVKKTPDITPGSQEHRFKKFGFVNQNKGKSAGNSPVIQKNQKGEDAIDEEFNLEEDFKKPSSIYFFKKK